MKSRAILMYAAAAVFLAIVALGGRTTPLAWDVAARGFGIAGDAGPGVNPGVSPAVAQSAAPVRTGAAGARPVIAVETSKGTFEIELYPEEAPKSVEHILALVKREFYDGMRVHRVEHDFVVQFGDPYSRDLARKSQWGRGGSGRAIGAVEISPKHTHQPGAVGLAYAAHPSLADSQLYIILADTERSRKLDGEYAVIGQVISGMDVVQKIELLDTVDRVSLK